MRLFVPFTMVNPATWDPLARFHPEGVDVSGDDNNYLRYWMARWADRRPFITVEHDMIVTPAQIHQLIDCPEPWCAFPYDGGPGQFPWFGCVRFREPTIDLFPHVWSDLYSWATAPKSDPVWRLVGAVPMKGPPPGEWDNSEWRPAWQHLDQWFIRAAQRAGVQCHRHLPEVHNDRDVPR